MKSIKAIRESKGIKAAWVSEQLGISNRQYLNWEKKPENLKKYQLDILARLFGVDYDDFF